MIEFPDSFNKESCPALKIAAHTKKQNDLLKTARKEIFDSFMNNMNYIPPLSNNNMMHIGASRTTSTLIFSADMTNDSRLIICHELLERFCTIIVDIGDIYKKNYANNITITDMDEFKQYEIDYNKCNNNKCNNNCIYNRHKNRCSNYTYITPMCVYKVTIDYE